MKYCIYISLIFFSTCRNFSKDFYVHPSPRGNNNNSTINISGCYYTRLALKGNTGDGEMKYVFFMYENGVAGLLRMPFLTYRQMDSLGYDKNSIEKEYSEFVSNRFKVKPYFEWGGYKIENQNLVVQIIRSVSGPSFELCTYEGQVFDDSSIYVKSCKMLNRPDYCESNFILKFYPITKPDSTNQLMRKNWYWTK